MLAPGMDLPWVVGATAAKQNAADLKTYGWELELNWRDRINKDWSYRIGFNLYDSQSEITKYNNETNLLGDKIYRKGMKMGEIWGYVTDRFYTEDDFNADGTLKPGIPIPKGAGKVFPGDVLYKNFDDDTETIWSGEGTADNPGDQRIIGNSTPRFHYGITAGISWKGLDLSIFLRGVGKRDYWRTDQIAWPTGGWGSLFKETLNFWTPTNTNAYYPCVFQRRGKHKLQPLETVEVSRQRLLPETAKHHAFLYLAQSMVPASLLRRCESILQRREPLHVGSPAGRTGNRYAVKRCLGISVHEKILFRYQCYILITNVL